MNNETLIYSVDELLTKEVGTSEVYSFDGPVEFEDVKAVSNISGEVTLLRIDDSINVATKNIDVEIELECQKCLDPFKVQINFPFSERQYFINRPELVEDPNDLFLINKQDLSVDLTDMLRQEIILHFPPITVCSESCKGLCSQCGLQLNKKNCNCKEEKIEESANKPLAILKDLIK